MTNAHELGESLRNVVTSLGFDTFTPIQQQAIPLLLEGRDVLARSPTGSGKTLAFALPILEKTTLGERALGALVLCPTRELSAQVAREFRRLGRDMVGLRVVVLSGGETIRPQVESLARGAHIAVGTPGRLIDLLSRDAIRLDAVRTVVLDEADRMLDMGFRPDVEKILRAVPKSAQRALFSATIPDPIRTLSRSFQRNPIEIAAAETAESTPEVRHLVARFERGARVAPLAACLSRDEVESAIVFCNQKVTVASLVDELARLGVSVAALHGDLEQFDRDQVLARLRNGSVRVLVATDVAARGIDIADLDLVVNYDPPTRAEDYVHRVGRTARAGKNGEAITFVAPSDSETAASLERECGFRFEPLPKDTGGARPNPKRPARMVTLFIGGGRKDKIRPTDLLGALTGDAGLAGTDVGKIEIHDRYAYVAVARESAPQALERLEQGKIKGRRFRVTWVG